MLMNAAKTVTIVISMLYATTQWVVTLAFVTLASSEMAELVKVVIISVFAKLIGIKIVVLKEN